MNEEDEIIWADSSSHVALTCAPINVNCTAQYVFGDGRSMSDDASRVGLRLVGEITETTCSHQPRKRIRRGIVWQVAYGAPLTPEGLAVSPQSSNHSEQVMVNSSPMKPYTH